MNGSVLVSSAGRRVALLRSFVDAFADLGVRGRVLASDMSALSSACRIADEAFVVPRCDAPEFVPALLRICETNDVRLLVPTIDTELSALALHREAFAAIGTTVVVSGPETVEIGLDKRRTHQWLEGRGFPTVRQAEASAVLAGADGWTFPLVIKPARGSASIGVGVVWSLDELGVRASRDGDLIVQSEAPGDEHTIDVYVDRNGRVRCTVPRRRIETRGGEVSKGVTVRSASLAALADEVVAALPEAFGALNVQVFVSSGDRMSVIEINPRFGGGYPLSDHAGARFSRWMVEETWGLEPSIDRDSWRDGVVMLRYDDAVFVGADEVGL